MNILILLTILVINIGCMKKHSISYYNIVYDLKDEEIKKINGLNLNYGLSKVKRFQLSDKDKNKLAKILGQVPEKIFRSLKKDFQGISFVENLGSNALLLKEFSRPIIVIDKNSLNIDLEEYFTKRDNSFFEKPSNDLIKYSVYSNLKDKSSILFLILHEYAHFLAGKSNFLNFNNGLYYESEFSKYSWNFENRFFLTLNSSNLRTVHSDLRSYTWSSKLNRNEKIKTFNSLAEANLYFLYSIRNVEEDFADSFAAMHLCVIDENLKIALSIDGKERISLDCKNKGPKMNTIENMKYF